MTVIEAWNLLMIAGVPGVLAIGTIIFLFLYLRSERAAPTEPPWLKAIRNDLDRIDESIAEGLRGCNRRSDSVDDRLREQAALLLEIKTTVGITARRNE